VALQTAIDSGDPVVMPSAAYNLGLLLTQQGDTAGARAAFKLAKSAKGTDASRRAAAALADLKRHRRRRR